MGERPLFMGGLFLLVNRMRIFQGLRKKNRALRQAQGPIFRLKRI